MKRIDPTIRSGLPSQRPGGVLGRHGCDEQARSTHADDPHLDPVSRRRPRKQSAAPDVPPREEEPRVAPIALAHEHYLIRRVRVDRRDEGPATSRVPGAATARTRSVTEPLTDWPSRSAQGSARPPSGARPVEHRLRTCGPTTDLERDPANRSQPGAGILNDSGTSPTVSTCLPTRAARPGRHPSAPPRARPTWARGRGRSSQLPQHLGSWAVVLDL